MQLTLNIEELTQAEVDRSRELWAQQEAQEFEQRRAERRGEFCKCCGLHHTEGQLHYFARAYYCAAHYPRAL